MRMTVAMDSAMPNSQLHIPLAPTPSTLTTMPAIVSVVITETSRLSVAMLMTTKASAKTSPSPTTAL
eukprot:scaffold589973_cov24-Prasinocladus_malaysianus.AAC.1